MTCSIKEVVHKQRLIFRGMGTYDFHTNLQKKIFIQKFYDRWGRGLKILFLHDVIYEWHQKCEIY